MANAALGGFGMLTSALGGVIGAGGALESGQAQSQMYNYQAGMAQMNAKIAKQNADYAINVGEHQAENYGLQAGQRMGQIKSAQGASGLDVNSGSAQQVQKGQATITNMDLTQIRSNAAKTAYNFDVQSVQDQQQAQLYRMAGAQSITASQYNAAASILGSASSVSNEWLQGQQSGLYNTSGNQNLGS